MFGFMILGLGCGGSLFRCLGLEIGVQGLSLWTAGAGNL